MNQESLLSGAADFDAYLPERATSNAYARPRLELKQRLSAWARRVTPRLADAGLVARVHESDEHLSLANHFRVEAQWVYFWSEQGPRTKIERLLDENRPIAARIEDPSPERRHAFLALKVDATGIEVSCAVHPEASIDVDNLRARLTEEANLTTELTTALAALPEQFVIGVGPDERAAVASATPTMIRALIERAASEGLPLFIGWSLEREVAHAHADILSEQHEDALVALAPVYLLIAWSPDNDHIHLETRLASLADERARAHAEAEAETEKWRAERAAEAERLRTQAKERSTPLTPPVRPTLATLFKARKAAAPPKAPKPAAVAAEPSAKESFVLKQSPAPAGSASGAVIEKGARVRALKGPFLGKIGVVSDLDGRGSARVLFGLLSTRVELADLTPASEGRERPALTTSHRNPLPPSPRRAK